MAWQDIKADNDTNKHIIFKYMKTGFTSLSAEELACTMVNPNFSIDFQANTQEDWSKYQFKTVERLQRCNFNLKWAQKQPASTEAISQLGTNLF